MAKGCVAGHPEHAPTHLPDTHEETGTHFGTLAGWMAVPKCLAWSVGRKSEVLLENRITEADSSFRQIPFFGTAAIFDGCSTIRRHLLGSGRWRIGAEMQTDET